MSISSTASSALFRATADCPRARVSPRKLYSTDTRPLPSPRPSSPSKLEPTCEKRTTSTSLQVAVTNQECLRAEQFLGDARPELDRARTVSRSMIFFLSAIAAVMLQRLAGVVALAVPRRALR